MKRLMIGVLVGLMGLTAGVPARADEDPIIRCQTLAPGDPDPLRRNSYDGGSDRVVAARVDGTDVMVLLPPDYAHVSRRYPVVYLIQGGINHHDCFLGRTDLIRFTEEVPDDQDAIVVMPDVGSGPVWHGKHGRPAAERAFVDGLMPWVDQTFRTIPDARYRAIAGFSAGGLGALMLAARHPDRFGAIAGLSAMAELDESDPGSLGIATAASVILMRRDGVLDPFNQFGDPVLAPIGWRAWNPVEHASNFGGLEVHLFTGDGTPCDEEELAATPTVDLWPTGFGFVEAGAKRGAEHLSAAMVGARVPHTLATGCGYHTYDTVEKQIHGWWPPMIASLGAPPPASFDHRRTDASFSVWGWTFTADPARAAEFLTVAGASCDEVTLTGSGLTAVSTAPCFAPGAHVRVDGVEHTADADGRVSFAVDLGPAHEHEQFTPAARALEAAGGYWTSARVALEEV